MLYYLHEWMAWYSPLRIFRFITFRALGAAGTAFLLSLLAGPAFIRMLQRLKFGQQVRREEAPPLFEFHGKKAGTPTMGGCLILFSILVATLCWAIPVNLYVLLTLTTMLAMGGIGFWDDLLKIRRKRSQGLGMRAKLLLQTAWVLVVVAVLWYTPETHERTRQLMLPFLKNPVLMDMGPVGTLVFYWLVLVGASNAVNLTDGLDGLAVGCSNSVAVAYLVMAYVAGHMHFADYLQVPYVAGSGELAVFAGAFLGAGLGFLWFNCHPAKVFMGDTGSLALGGAIAMIAIAIKQELMLLLVGGIFVLEAASVLLQVAYFRWSGGRRLFRCAPIHHHFELLEKDRALREGRDIEVVETTITIRFWILSIICALLGVAALKIR